MTDRPDVPAELAELDDDALAALIEQLTAEFDRLLDEGSRDVATMTALADDIDRLSGEVTARETAEAEADAAIAALADRVRGSNDEGDPDPEPEGDGDDDAADEEARVPVLASATNRTSRPALGDIARRTPRPRIEQRRTPSIAITAAADLPGVSPGANISLDQVAQSFHDRARTLSEGQRAPVARVEIPHTHRLGTDPTANARTINDLIGQPSATALVASGGWCAPSQPLFDLFDIGPDTNDLFDLPGLGTDVRAGVLVPSFFTTSDASGALWNWTEAQDMGISSTVTNKALTANVATITTAAAHNLSVGRTVVVSGVGAPFDGTWVVASVPTTTTFTYAVTAANVTSAAATGTVGAVKGCLKIPCPTWTEARLEAEGLCVTHGNLSDRAWPELTRQFLSVVMGAHQRRLSAAKIAKVLSGATVVAPAASLTPSDAAGDLLNVISLAADDLRSQYRVSKSRSIDVLLPSWIVDVLRSTLAMRGGVDLLSVSDSDVVGYMTARGVRPQFTPDWQPLYTTTPATAWPANVTFAMWFTGAYVSIDGGSIDLGVVRDSTLNATNDFTAAWSEQFFQVVRRGPLARSYTVPLGVDGVTACCP
jgi:hypothetical protein